MVSDGAYIIHTRMQCGKAFCGVKVIFQGLSGISRVHFEKKKKKTGLFQGISVVSERHLVILVLIKFLSKAY